jgi:hypothetical protein
MIVQEWRRKIRTAMVLMPMLIYMDDAIYFLFISIDYIV